MISELGERIMERMDRLGEEVGLLKQELMRREGLWMEEKKEMYRRIEGLEKRVVELEAMREKESGGEGREERGGGEKNREMEVAVVEKMKGIGRRLEIKEREERRNNIVIRRMEERSAEVRERVEKVMKEIGTQVEIEGIRRIRGKEGGEEEMVVVRLGSREQKRQVIERKKGLRGKQTRIEDDLTWEERK